MQDARCRIQDERSRIQDAGYLASRIMDRQHVVLPHLGSAQRAISCIMHLGSCILDRREAPYPASCILDPVSWIGATRHILHHASWILSLGSAQRAIILFPTFAEYNGLPADLLKQEFISNGRGYSVIRVEPRNPKYPILARGLLDNLVYKFSVDQVKEALERKKKV